MRRIASASREASRVARWTLSLPEISLSQLMSSRTLACPATDILLLRSESDELSSDHSAGQDDSGFPPPVEEAVEAGLAQFDDIQHVAFRIDPDWAMLMARFKTLHQFLRVFGRLRTVYFIITKEKSQTLARIEDKVFHSDGILLQEVDGLRHGTALLHYQLLPSALGLQSRDGLGQGRNGNSRNTLAGHEVASRRRCRLRSRLLYSVIV